MNWAGDPHQEWKTRVADENRLIVVDGLNQVIMRADSMETLLEWWPRTVKNFMHARVYREIDISIELEAAAELRAKALEAEQSRKDEQRLALASQRANEKEFYDDSEDNFWGN